MNQEYRDKLRKLIGVSERELDAVLHVTQFSEPDRDELRELFQQSLSRKDDIEFSKVVGFVLFSVYAELFKIHSSKDYHALANTFLAVSYVREYIIDKYELSKIDEPHKITLSSALTLHEVGTTSIIIKANSRYALKILKWKYRENPKVCQGIKEYQSKYGGSSIYLPDIYKSGDTFILMEFIKGMTLREYLSRYCHVKSEVTRDRVEILSQDTPLIRRLIQYYRAGRARRRDKEKEGGSSSHLEKISAVDKIIVLLCDALYDINLPHHDLSPDNIILRQREDDVWDMKLIDFGVNYIIMEKIGSASSISGAQTYLAKEVLDSPDGTHNKADLYSIGIILLEMLGDSRLEIQEMGYQLDLAWKKYPEYAKIVEDLIDKDPKVRLVEVAGDSQDAYTFLKQKRLKYAATISSLDTQRGKSWIKMLLEKVFIFRQWDSIKEMIGKQQALAVIHLSEHEDQNQIKLAKRTKLCHVVIMFLFTMLTLNDFGVLKVAHVFGLLHIPLGDVLIHTLELIGTAPWHENLPRRLVALTFSIVASQYFVNIFSRLAATKKTNCVYALMRFNAWCFALPIIPALFFPKIWPYCSGIGVFFASLNNLASYIVARTSISKMNRSIHRRQSSSLNDFILEFRKWWIAMFLYGVALIGVGFLISFGIARDEWIYAIIVSLIVNIGIMFRDACANDAPSMRAGLERTFFGLARLELKSKIRR